MPIFKQPLFQQTAPMPVQQNTAPTGMYTNVLYPNINISLSNHLHLHNSHTKYKMSDKF